MSRGDQAMTRDAREIEREGMLSDMETLQAEKRDLHAEIGRLEAENADLQRELNDTLLGPTMVQNQRAEIERLKAAHDDYVVAANANVCALYRDIERLKAENGPMRAHLGEAFCISFMDPKP